MASLTSSTHDSSNSDGESDETPSTPQSPNTESVTRGVPEKNLSIWEPTLVDFPISIKGDIVKFISCGSAHSLALTGLKIFFFFIWNFPGIFFSDLGRVFVWGAGSGYALGSGKQKNSGSPQLVDALSAMIVRQVSAGGNASMCLIGLPSSSLEIFRNISLQRSAKKENIGVYVGTYNINNKKTALTVRYEIFFFFLLNEYFWRKIFFIEKHFIF